MTAADVLCFMAGAVFVLAVAGVVLAVSPTGAPPQPDDGPDGYDRRGRPVGRNHGR
jgi:hypothetical protein